jgi:integrase/recombinase XerC
LPLTWTTPEIVHEYLAWCQERELAVSTIQTYRGVLNRLAYWLSKKGAALLTATRDQLNAWRSQLHYTRKTVAMYVTAVRSFYKWAHRAGLIPTDPAWQLIAPRVPQGASRPIREDRLAQVLALATGMLRLWYVLAAYTGLRAGEIAALSWQDIVDYGDGQYIEIQGKGSKPRKQPISPFVWSEILIYGRQSRGPIFHKADGRAFSPNYLDKRANCWLHEHGFWETMHMFRHRYGTMSARVTGGNLLLVGGSMGHGNTNTTKIYTEVYMPEVLDMVCAIQPSGWPGSRIAS